MLPVWNELVTFWAQTMLLCWPGSGVYPSLKLSPFSLIADHPYRPPAHTQSPITPNNILSSTKHWYHLYSGGITTCVYTILTQNTTLNLGVTFWIRVSSTQRSMEVFEILHLLNEFENCRRPGRCLSMWHMLLCLTIINKLKEIWI